MMANLPAIFMFAGLVSLVTFFILLFKPNRPLPLRIPTFRFGSETSSSLQKLAIRPPPWILWLCVLLFSLGCYLAYWPSPKLFPEEKQDNALVWVDETFSAVVGRKGVESRDIATQIFNEFKKVHFVTRNVESQILLLLPVLSVADLTKLIDERLLSEPSVGDLNFDPEILKSILQKSDIHKPVFIALSDGQQNTLSRLGPLKESVSEFRLIETGVADVLSGVKKEIVPTHLLQQWGLATTEKSDFTYFKTEYNIPIEARPHLQVESIGKHQFLSVQDQSEALFPLVSGCRFATPASWELNPFGDVDSLATYMRSSFRQYRCREGIPQSRSPWMYRQGSLWVVPATEDILNSLNQRLWLPDDFRADADVLVYVASPELNSATQPYLTKQAVQLDAGNAVQIPLDLLPIPPSQSYDFLNRTGTFEPSYTSANDVPLAFKLKGAPIYWLRTYATMTNGELGRSAAWNQWWLDIVKHVSDKSSYLRVFVDHNDAVGKISADEKRLNLQSLRFDDTASALSLGLRRNPSPRDSYQLLTLSNGERTHLFLTAEEFAFKMGGQENIAARVKDNAAPVYAKFGAIIAASAVMFLWWLRRRESGFLKSVVTLLFCLLVPTMAHAQIRFSPRRLGGVDKNYAVPFRISWCDAVIPEAVQSRYQQLRSLLLGRGTIVLPSTLLAGHCAPLQSEIWWTNDTASMQPQVLASHIALGGVFIVEGQGNGDDLFSRSLGALSDPSIGLAWERPSRRGMLYRSFYLLHQFDGCLNEQSYVLSLRKKMNAQSPVGLWTSARFLTSDSGHDCFEINDDYRTRSFVNLMYALFSTDYKEDQMQLPELLKRIRRLGIEP